MQNNDILHALQVTDLTITGAGVARADGRVVFIDGALPGSVVNARITGVHKGVVRAVQQELVVPSPFAVQPRCVHAEECGACLWQHFARQGELDWKTKQVKETLARIGAVQNIAVAPALPLPCDFGFRNKMAFAFGQEGAQLLLGLRRRNGKGIVPVDQCLMQDGPTMQILQKVRSLAKDYGLEGWREKPDEKRCRGYLRFLLVRIPDYRPDGTLQVMVECITGPGHDLAPPFSAGSKISNREAVRRMGEELVRDFGLLGFVHSERKALNDVAQGDRRIWSAKNDCLIEQYGELKLAIPYNAFAQTNTRAAIMIYELVRREANLDGTQCVWDLYSGVGAIALYLADKAREVHGFEIDPLAVKAAKNNSKALGFEHCFFHQGAITAELLQALPQPGLIVVDPPRAGLEAQVISAISATKARRMIYISCDVATQARDLNKLSATWNPVTSTPIDMFPYTPHVENVVVLNRIDA